ncbi:hypothetical protein EPUS_04284 [Endocarpon pusillum Z07020]|uniref:Heterokaryon incompatibility domain-containing protein n=1 Tax=Endocarpon pusillum (strain Z07020 / HMAS-L-300199) TaxID=1263415 RepID=U1HU78_ENDPU|nr:uncharacterized protein EPUS_04284 [Endocarpon pusillum Z07020]ERF72849.1 hypothetical protein EPUS_04284 [Endocarpon pusillum Z07020]
MVEEKPHLRNSQTHNSHSEGQQQSPGYYPGQINQHGQSTHYGGSAPSQQQQFPAHRPHGGGFVPEPQQQAPAHRPHGGGFVPEPQQQAPAHRPHGGGFVPGQHSPVSGNYNSTSAEQQHGQGQGQGQDRWQYIDAASKQAMGPSYERSSTSKGPSSDTMPKHSELKPSELGPSQTVLAQYVPPRKYQRGYWNIWNDRNMWRWKFPNAYQMPGLRFESYELIRHRDVLQRVLDSPEDDRYLSPTDGHLSKLVVQAVDDVYDTRARSTWRRTFMRDVSPLMVRIANWAINSVPLDKAHWSGEDWALVSAKWLLACVLLMGVMPVPTPGEGEIRNRGWYDPFPYRFWGYAKYWRNLHENETKTGNADEEHRRAQQRIKNQEIGLEKELSEEDGGLNPVDDRLLQPRYLCFLDTSQTQMPATPMKVEDWKAREPSATQPEYMFIAYTAEQFRGLKDLQALAQLAERATREAGLSAYWIGSSCMPDEQELEQDVYRISDVIRGAKAMAIIVGHPVNNRSENFSPEDLLKQWGRRMWTLPEALLSPRGNSIKIYSRVTDEPWEILKANFAHIVWHDAPWTRQLMDHYEGTLILSPLELVVLALRCLNTRDVDRETHFPGDLSYVLMGLLRRRPRANRFDSAFQAFARLSLANDSNKLIERLVCIHPKNPDQTWSCTEDAWNVQLWDIYPTIQVAGVGHDDTVILDGAFGAAIRWKSFAPVAYASQTSWKRYTANLALRSSSLVFLTGTILLGIGARAGGTLRAVGVALMLFSVAVVLASPYLVRVQYGGKLWDTQPWFFGFEGYLDIETIESHIFGTYRGRLTWSPSSSPLSRHYSNEFGECIGLDPTSDVEVRRLVEEARTAAYGKQKIFTLVDTFTLQVTLFSAVRPPITALLCGSEGGMQRAIMCSYDAKTQTLYRESVLRMETLVLERMSRVGRVRFGFRRPLPRTQESA